MLIALKDTHLNYIAKLEKYNSNYGNVDVLLPAITSGKQKSSIIIKESDSRKSK
jgi:hypothetical protein